MSHESELISQSLLKSCVHSVGYWVPPAVPSHMWTNEPAGEHHWSSPVALQPLDESRTKPTGDGSNCTWFCYCHTHFIGFIADLWWTWALGDFYMSWPSGINGNVRGWFLDDYLLHVLWRVRSFCNVQRACLHVPGLLVRPCSTSLLPSLSVAPQRNPRCQGNLGFLTTLAGACSQQSIKKTELLPEWHLLTRNSNAWDRPSGNNTCMRKCSLHTLVVTVSLMFGNSLCLEVGTKILTGFKMRWSKTVMWCCLSE